MTRDEIIRLAREAGLGEHTNYEYEQIWELKNVEALEHFAELIVEECADIAKHHVMNISTYADAEFVNKQIKKHFGVE